MKKMVKWSTYLGMIVFTFTGFMACENFGAEHQVSYTEILDVDADGVSAIIETELKTVVTEEPITVSDDEALLLHMLDEEKLARDVYIILYEKWDVQIFERIAAAEQKHLDAVLYLIENYTSLGVEVGDDHKYSDEVFTALYDKLIAQGSESIEQAYSVGALIEELDIYDLKNCMAQTANENILIVFENLLRGSQNHLRAFNRNLVNLGIQYEPQYLDTLSYEEIVSAPMEKGKRYAKQNRKRGNGNKGKGNGNKKGSGVCTN